MIARPSVALLLAAALVAPLAGCMDRATLDVLHVDDIELTFVEPNRVELAFNVYQFQGSRSAIVTFVEIGTVLRESVENATENPMHASTRLEAPEEPLMTGDVAAFNYTFELEAPADDPEALSIWSSAILVRYRLDGAGSGGEVAYSSPCFTRDNTPIETASVLCEEVYTYEKGKEAALPGTPEWQTRLDACCRSE